jgi:hypothetical protein
MHPEKISSPKEQAECKTGDSKVKPALMDTTGVSTLLRVEKAG